MKKSLALFLAAIMLTALIPGCTSDGTENLNVITTEMSTADDTIGTNITEAIVDTGSITTFDDRIYLDTCNPINYSVHYNGVFSCWFYGVPTESSYLIFDNIDSDNTYEDPRDIADNVVDKWYIKKYGFSESDFVDQNLFRPTALHFIKDLEISKEEFIEASKKCPYPEYTYAEIDALFSDDIADIYAAFLNPNAILVGEKVYTPKMIHKMTFDDLVAVGITKADIAKKMETDWDKFLCGSKFYVYMLDICKANNIEITESERYKGYYIANSIEPFEITREFKEFDYLHYFTDTSEATE